MSLVEVWFVGIECRIRQESEDEVFGTVKVVAGDGTPTNAVPFPESGYWRLGKAGQRIATAQIPLYRGPVTELAIAGTLVEHDSGDVEAEKRIISTAVSTAATTALAAYTAGLGAAAQPLIDLLARGLVGLAAGALGIADDVYNPGAVALRAAELPNANARRRTLRRNDDPRAIDWTDVLVLEGRDDGGDRGVYALYFDVRPIAGSTTAPSTPSTSTAPSPSTGTPAPSGAKPAAPTTLGPVLWSGADWAWAEPKGALAERVQRALKARGRYTGVVDGDFGTLTRKGVQETLKVSGVFVGTIDGQPGRGAAYGVQDYAKRFGDYTGPRDGKPGLKTWEGFALGLERP